MGTYLGELAALGTSLAFSLTSTMFTLAGRRVGSLVVNRTRLIFALTFLLTAHWFFLGSLLPWEAEPRRWLWLGLSGVVGLVLGDIFLFQASIWIGPRLSMLMMSLLPISYHVFKERFGWGAFAGTALAIAGVALLFLV